MLSELQRPDVAGRTDLLARLTAQARDLGKPGRDDVYGDGELGGAYK